MNSLFNEVILREDTRRKSYFIRYLPILLITGALAILPWILMRNIDTLTYTILSLIGKIIPAIYQELYLSLFIIKIILSTIFGILFIVFLVNGIRNTMIPRLVVTQHRVCLVKREHKYYEARFDKIDAFVIKGKKLIVYANGRKVFAFGPLDDVYTTRDAITKIMEGQFSPEETEEFDPREIHKWEEEPHMTSRQTKPTETEENLPNLEENQNHMFAT